MNEIIRVTINEEGVQIVSARDLYIGLELNKAHWKRWYQSNIIENDYFKESVDWVGFTTMVNGNETQDFAITLEFAKHIAMMARTEKSHDYRNYFIDCENKIKQPTKQLSSMELLRLQYKALEEQDQKIEEVNKKVDKKFDDLPLFPTDSKILKKLVNQTVVPLLGGKKSKAYKELSRKVFSDLYKQIHREFGVTGCEEIKRKDLEIVKEIISNYKLPRALEIEINMINSQVAFA